MALTTVYALTCYTVIVIVCECVDRWRQLVPRWQAMQLWAALGFSRLALLFRMYNIPLMSDSAASDELINRQVGTRLDHC